MSQADQSSNKLQPSQKTGEGPTMRTQDGQEMAVPADGNLGLLAMGYKGLMVWREARAKSGWTAKKAADAARSMMPEQPKSEGKGKAKPSPEGAEQKSAPAPEAGTADSTGGIDPDAMIPFGN